MFYPVEGGAVYKIEDNCFGFTYECQLPPIGYGVNSMTGELQSTDIIKRSDKDEECFWERYVLPPYWKERRKREKERQKFDRYFFDPELENIRGREWNRRLCGVWFHNYNPKKQKVELLYITGTHYLYATYWKFQGKFMDFRINDMECWYVVKYCETDPNCLGLNEITKRKLGKTARLGCWIYERTSRMANSHAGLQSKTDPDAEEVFKKAVVMPWKTLPDFFRPIYDTNKGDTPSDEIRFFQPSKRGSSIIEYEDEQDEALNSWIDYGASGESVYDGPELETYGSDESGKTKRPTSIKERQNTVRYCSEIDGVFKGKQWYTTTVEIEEDKKGNLEEDNYEFQELTAMSNPLERDKNGRTMSGLYTYFLPAQKGMYFDKYGYPDEDRALVFLLNTEEKLKAEGKLRELSSFKRKNPKNFKEAFSADGTQTLYNPELLNTQLDEISWTNKFTEFGDLEWINGDRLFYEKEINGKIEVVPNGLQWNPNPNGKFEKVKDWLPKEQNKVIYRNGVFMPNNDNSINIGCDPFKYDKTKDKRRSNCAAFGYQLPDPAYPDDVYDDMFTIRYSYREESTRKANEDVLKLAWWCGCRVLFERNINHWKDYFIDNNCADFLVWLEGEVEPGIITATGSSGVQAICDYTESYINQHIHKVYFKTLIRKETGWLGFKVEDTEKFDEPMAAGITLIRVRGVKRKLKSRANNRDISDFFPKTSGWTY